MLKTSRFRNAPKLGDTEFASLPLLCEHGVLTKFTNRPNVLAAQQHRNNASIRLLVDSSTKSVQRGAKVIVCKIGSQKGPASRH